MTPTTLQIFDETADAKPAPSYEVKARDLLAALKSVCAAVARGRDARYYLQGVCFEPRDGSLFLTATDGKRLHHTSIPLETWNYFAPGLALAIPWRRDKGRDDCALAEIAAALRGLKDNARITFERGDSPHVLYERVAFQIGNAVLRTPIIDGSFPDYRHIIPKTGIGINGVCFDIREPSAVLASLKTAQWNRLQAKRTARELHLGIKNGAAIATLETIRNGVRVTCAAPGWRDEFTWSERIARFGLGLDYLSASTSFDAAHLIDMIEALGTKDKICGEAADVNCAFRFQRQYKPAPLVVLMPERPHE